MEGELTVACCHWGSWPIYYVEALRTAVDRYLDRPHRFVCLSDWALFDDVDTVPLPVQWPRNLRKMWLYAPDNGLQGRVLALDLDDIPVGSLAPLADYTGRFCCIEDPNATGLAGGGTLSFEAGDPWLTERLYQPLVDDLEEVMSISGGFERHWLRHALPEADFWPNEFIADAKTPEEAIIVKVPPSARVVHFHGRPRPHTVWRPWLEAHFRSYL